jgi:hypothetical protein
LRQDCGYVALRQSANGIRRSLIRLPLIAWNWSPRHVVRREGVLVAIVGASISAGFERRSTPDRRSSPDRLSPINRRSSSDRVSTPLRRSVPERLSVNRLSSSPIAASPGSPERNIHVATWGAPRVPGECSIAAKGLAKIISESGCRICLKVELSPPTCVESTNSAEGFRV